MRSGLMYGNLCLLVVVVLATTTYGRVFSVERMEIERPVTVHSGSFKNCSAVPFNITWSPEPFSPSGPLKLIVDYLVPHSMDGGSYDITIWFHGDPTPFLEFADNFSCADVQQYLPCPIPKGLKFHLNKVYEHIPNVGSYPGDYDVKVDIKNHQGQEMICLEGRLIILSN